jgi:dTDP-4-dehydrorhamnose 3,5-epimerase
MKEYALKGVKVQEINLIPDERGFFAEALRQDWKDLLEEEWIVQANISYSYPNIVRAWHKHERGQVDYFLVLKGAMKICAYEEETGKLVEIIASGEKPSIVRIPGKYLHGTKTVSNTPSLTVYFVTNFTITKVQTKSQTMERPKNNPNRNKRPKR